MRQRIINIYEVGDIIRDFSGNEWEVIAVSALGGPVLKNLTDHRVIGYGSAPFADEDEWDYVSGEYTLDTLETRLRGLTTNHGDGFEFPRLAESDVTYFAKMMQGNFDDRS